MDRPHCEFCSLESLMVKRLAGRCVLHCLRLGLFDVLEREPISAECLAEQFGFKTAAIEALLDLLESQGLVGKESKGYRNTPVSSEYLVAPSPFFLGKYLELNHRFEAMVDLRFDEMLRGETGTGQVADDGWSSEDTMAGMIQYARLGGLQDTVDFVSGLPGFLDARLMCDMGGNHGAFSMALLDRNPDMRGEIMDLPAVTSAADTRIMELGYAERLSTVGVDLINDPLPESRYDLMLASHILYAFLEDMSGILSRIHDALRPGGWFVAHHMDPEGDEPTDIARVRELMTRMMGYTSHFISRTQLEHALSNAGFDGIVAASAGQNRAGLVMAARKH